MTDHGEAFDPVTIKHLEFIQTVIARLANDSFLMKGWAVTVAGAFFGVAVNQMNWRVAAIGLLPLLAFWGLDAYFLSRERMYRQMYEAVRIGDTRVEPLSMDYRPFIEKGQWLLWREPRPVWLRTFWSRTLWLFYIPSVAVGIALIVVGGVHWK